MNNQLSGFSIVLCTYNGQQRLGPTLQHLAALQLPEGYGAELIIVNNASTDDTVHFCQQAWQQLGAPYRLSVIDEPRPGKGFAVESGYDAALFSYIVTVDDDNWLQPDYLLEAKALFDMDASIGILQGHSTGVFEVPPPEWVQTVKEYFIIGSPQKEVGYFPENNFFVWGAGMVIRTSDWRYLRSLGFAFLTSKVPGKAAGEDNELAIALLIMGRKIYYSDKLRYQHYMPAARVSWEKLQENFETHGYVSYYFYLYEVVLRSVNEALSFDAIKKGYKKYLHQKRKSFTVKQYLAYRLKPNQEVYQLHMHQWYTMNKWFNKLQHGAQKDIYFIKRWLQPLLLQGKKTFEWPNLFNTSKHLLL